MSVAQETIKPPIIETFPYPALGRKLSALPLHPETTLGKKIASPSGPDISSFLKYIASNIDTYPPLEKYLLSLSETGQLRTIDDIYQFVVWYTENATKIKPYYIKTGQSVEPENWKGKLIQVFAQQPRLPGENIQTDKLIKLQAGEITFAQFLKSHHYSLGSKLQLPTVDFTQVRGVSDDNPIQTLQYEAKKAYCAVVAAIPPISTSRLRTFIQQKYPEIALQINQPGDDQSMNTNAIQNENLPNTAAEQPQLFLKLQHNFENGQITTLLESTNMLNWQLVTIAKELRQKSQTDKAAEPQFALGYETQMTPLDSGLFYLKVAPEESVQLLPTTNNIRRELHTQHSNSTIIQTQPGDILLLKRGKNILYLEVTVGSENTSDEYSALPIVSPEICAVQPRFRKLTSFLEETSSLAVLPVGWLKVALEFIETATAEDPDTIPQLNELATLLQEHIAQLLELGAETAVVARMLEAYDIIRGFSPGGWAITPQFFHTLLTQTTLPSKEEWIKVFKAIEDPTEVPKIAVHLREHMPEVSNEWLEFQYQEATGHHTVGSIVNALLLPLKPENQQKVTKQILNSCYQYKAEILGGSVANIQQFVSMLLKQLPKEISPQEADQIKNQKLTILFLFAEVCETPEAFETLNTAVIDTLIHSDSATEVIDRSKKSQKRSALEYDAETQQLSWKYDLALLAENSGEVGLAQLVRSTLMQPQCLCTLTIAMEHADDLTAAQLKRKPPGMSPDTLKATIMTSTLLDASQKFAERGYDRNVYIYQQQLRKIVTALQTTHQLIQIGKSKNIPFSDESLWNKNVNELIGQLSSFENKGEILTITSLDKLDTQRLVILINSRPELLTAVLELSLRVLRLYSTLNFDENEINATRSTLHNTLDDLFQDQMSSLLTRKKYIVDSHGWGGSADVDKPFIAKIISFVNPEFRSSMAHIGISNKGSESSGFYVKTLSQMLEINIADTMKILTASERYARFAGGNHLLMAAQGLRGNSPLRIAHSMDGATALVESMAQSAWEGFMQKSYLPLICSLAPVLTDRSKILLLGASATATESSSETNMNGSVKTRKVPGNLLSLSTSSSALISPRTQEAVSSLAHTLGVDKRIVLAFVANIHPIRRDITTSNFGHAIAYLRHCTDTLKQSRPPTRKELTIFKQRMKEGLLSIAIYELDNILDPAAQMKALELNGKLVGGNPVHIFFDYLKNVYEHVPEIFVGKVLNLNNCTHYGNEAGLNYSDPNSHLKFTQTIAALVNAALNRQGLTQ